MSYRAGISASMAELGFKPGEPHFICDGCGATHSVYTARGDVAQWFMRRRSPPPGWRGLRMATGEKRWDLCPACWKDNDKPGATDAE